MGIDRARRKAQCIRDLASCIALGHTPQHLALPRGECRKQLARFGLLRLLPSDLPNWQRHDGKEPAAPLIVFAGGNPENIGPMSRLRATVVCGTSARARAPGSCACRSGFALAVWRWRRANRFN